MTTLILGEPAISRKRVAEIIRFRQMTLSGPNKFILKKKN